MVSMVKKLDTRASHAWLGLNPINIMNPITLHRVQHPNHELCHRTDDVTQHHESNSTSSNGIQCSKTSTVPTSAASLIAAAILATVESLTEMLDAPRFCRARPVALCPLSRSADLFAEVSTTSRPASVVVVVAVVVWGGEMTGPWTVVVARCGVVAGGVVWSGVCVRSRELWVQEKKGA
jgi:hypothetical protein